MKFRVEKVDDIVIVTLPGDVLDAHNAQEFKQDIASVLESDSKVVFNMGEMRFIDSSGCGALLSCVRKLKEQGGELKLFNVSKEVSAIFKLIRLNQVLAIFHAREEALKAFKDQG